VASDWFDDAGQGAAVDVNELVDVIPMKALLDVVQLGALLSLGTTSDGGALGVTITVDGRWRREYFRDSESLTAWLAEALPAVESARGADRPSAARGQRQRRQRGA
jgi:Tfp pilus assembly protein PilN